MLGDRVTTILRRCGLVLIALGFLAGAFVLFSVDARWAMLNHERTQDERWPLGVLGDSDSHSFQDRATFPLGSGVRGGEHADVTWQWVDALQRLRGDQIDQGPWGDWGSRSVQFSHLQDKLGLWNRRIRKQDFLFNLARSGAVCADLERGPLQQVKPLLVQMDRDPQRWERGLVVIRIGINDLGTEAFLERLVQQDTSAFGKIDACVADIGSAVQTIRAKHPQTRFVLVGIFNNAHWVNLLSKWHDAAALARIDAGMDRFDAGLRRLSQQVGGAVFFDDRAWFTSRWGGRDAAGVPAYRTLVVRPGLAVTNTKGDTWNHCSLADGHNGSVWNALWAQSLIELVRTELQMPVTSITHDEVQRLFASGAGGVPPASAVSASQPLTSTH
jgi:GDSL-like Lipase/Acylhydrolase family